LQFRSLDAQLALDARGRHPVCPPSTRHWVRSTVSYVQKAWITYGQVRLC